MSSGQVPLTTSDATSLHPEFSTRGDRVTTLANILKAMHLGTTKKDEQLSNMIIKPEGLTVVTQKAKSLVSRLNLRQSYFTNYDCLEEDIKICVDIRTLIQVLTIFGSEQIDFHFEYKKTNDFLQIVLSHFEDQSITECQLFTFNELVEIPNLRWRDSQTVNRLTVNTPYFKDTFNEIDALGKDEDIVSIHIIKGNEEQLNDLNYNINNIEFNPNEIDEIDENEEKKVMDYEGDKDKNINSKMMRSSVEIGIRCDTLQFVGVIPMADDICVQFQFDEPKKYLYRLSLLRPALRAAAKSDRIRLDFNEQGTLRVQHVFNDSEGVAWVEFIILHQDNDFVDSDDDD